MENITITHFVNPHRFWFKREDFEQDDEISTFRQNLSKALRKQEFDAVTWTPAVGEIVAYFHKIVGVWDRAVIREISFDGDITVWIEYFGYPQKVRKKEIRPMPSSVKLPTKKIVREGALYQLVPSQRKFNLYSLKHEMTECGQIWADAAIELMKNVIDSAERITFDTKNILDSIYHGNLIFHMPHGAILAAEELLSDYCKKSDRYLEVLQRDKLRLPGDEIASEAPSNTKHSVNEWVEKSIDFKNETFDDSVSTYQPPPPPKGNTPRRTVFNEYQTPSNDQASSIARSARVPPPVPREEESSWRPGHQPMPQGFARGFMAEEQTLHAPSGPKTFQKPPPEMPPNPMQKSTNSGTASTNLSIDNFRKIFDSQAQRMKQVYLEKQKSQSSVNASSVNADNPSEGGGGGSSRAHLMPQPAGMLRMEPSKKSKAKMDRAMRNGGRDSPEIDLRQLGEVPVERTAKKRYQRLLVHCPLPVKMVENISDADFWEDVHIKLRQTGINDVHRIQSHAWPHIYRGGSAILVARKKSGRTLAYIPMLFTRMMQDHETGVKLREGARAIVICSCAKKVEQTCKRFDGFNNRHKLQLSVLASHSPRDTENHVINLQNGYDILFTTVPAFRRLLDYAVKENVDIVQRENLQYIIVDDFDDITMSFSREVHSLLKMLMANDEHGKCKAQIVITSSRWNPKFMMYIQKFDNPMVCITDGVEAARYAGSHFSLQLKTREQKVLAVRDMLATETYFSEPTMIVCNTAEEVNYLSDILRKISVCVIAITDISENIKMQSNGVILCTDACILNSNVRNIQNLIHFSLPEKWSMYVTRFVACYDYYEDQVTNGPTTKAPAQITIFCDTENDEQLPRLLDFMQRFDNVDIAPELLACANANVEAKEQRRVQEGVELCSTMMEFGACRLKHYECTYRHIFTDSDAPLPILPVKNFIRLRIDRVMTPLHFKCHILHSMENRLAPDTEWRTEMQSDKFYVFQSDLDRHMMIEANQMTPSSKDIKKHDIYVHPFDYRYLRVRVDTIIRDGSRVYVDIYGVDKAKMKEKVPAQELFIVPEEFRDFPHQLIDVRYFGLVPNDHERVWDEHSTNMVKVWVNKAQESSNVAFLGEIELTLNNLIYVKTLYCVEYIESAPSSFVKFSLRQRILEKKIGVQNKDKIGFLKNLADRYGILERPKVPKVPKLPPQIPSRWMTLPKEDFVNVFILNFDSPTEFYVQDLTREGKDLKEVKEKISEFVGDGMELKVLKDLRIGNHCLVRFDDDYMRGKIWERTPEDDAYHIFLVDEGIIEIFNANELYEISESLIKEYPFFAIRCALLGVTVRASNSSDEEVEANEIYEKYFRVPNDRYALNAYTVDEKIHQCGANWKVMVHSVIIVAADEEDPVVNKNVVVGKVCDKDDDDWEKIEKFARDVEQHPDVMRELTKRLEDEPEEDYDELIPAEIVERKAPTIEVAGEPREFSLPIRQFMQAPHIEWRQTNQEIILYIAAVDMKDYMFKLRVNYLMVCIVFEEETKHGCVLNFFGCIDPEKSDCKVRGNRIVMHLQKCIAGKRHKWPRLMDLAERVAWLHEIIDVGTVSDSEESVCDEQPVKGMKQIGESDPDAESTEDEKSQVSDNEIHFEEHFV